MVSSQSGDVAPVCDGYDTMEEPCFSEATRAFFNKANGEGWVLCCARHSPIPRQDYTRKTMHQYRRRFDVE